MESPSPTTSADADGEMHSEPKRKKQINEIKSPLIFDNFSKVPLSKTPGTKLSLPRNVGGKFNIRKKRLSFEDNPEKEQGLTHSFEFDLFDDNSSDIALSQCSAERKNIYQFENKSLLVRTKNIEKEQKSTEDSDSENIENIANYLKRQLAEDKPTEEKIEENKLNFPKINTMKNIKKSKLMKNTESEFDELNKSQTVNQNCKNLRTNDTVSSVASLGKTRNNKNKMPLVLLNKCDVSMKINRFSMNTMTTKINVNGKKYSFREKSLEKNISKNSSKLITNSSSNIHNRNANEIGKCVLNLEIKANANFQLSTASKNYNLPSTSSDNVTKYEKSIFSNKPKSVPENRDRTTLLSTDSTNFNLKDYSLAHKIKTKMEEYKQLEKYYHKMEDLENAIKIWKNGFNETINDLSKLMERSVDEICHLFKIPVKFLEQS